MELWIRSQDRTRLAKIDGISLYVAGGNIDCNGVKFAHYETRERALEVLDEIQNIIQPRVYMKAPLKVNTKDLIEDLTNEICLHTTQQVEMELKQAGQFVYQMPKE